MNRLKQLLLSLLIIGPGALMASVDLTPPPPPIAATAPTTESIKEGIRQEKLQIAYDAAENVAARVMKKNGCEDEYAEAVAHAAVDYGVSPRVLAAVAVVESTCDPTRIAKHPHDKFVDAGMYQINTKVHREWTLKQLLNPYVNARAGARILAEGIHKYGVFQGLHAYNGFGPASHPTDDSYALTVYHKAGLTPPVEAVWPS